MPTNIDFIYELINIEKQTIKESTNSINNRIAIIELTRCLDHSFCSHKYFLPPSNKEYSRVINIHNFIYTGYWDAINLFLDKSIYESGYPLYPTNENLIRWSNSTLIRLGHIGHILKFIELSKQDIVKLTRENNIFYFKNKSQSPGREQLSVGDFIWWQNYQSFSNEEEHRLDRLKLLVEKQLIDSVEIDKNHFIKYSCTKELDEFYEILGSYTRRQLLGSDAFPNEAKFGDLQYQDIVKIIEALIGYTLKHIDHCNALFKKSNYTINPWNVYTIYERLDDLAYSISIHKNIDYNLVYDFLEFFSVSDKNNYLLGKSPGSSSPPLIKISNEHVLKSVAGTLGNPFTFLIRSLKLNFENDFFNAVNHREKIFKLELYQLFSGAPHIINNQQNIELREGGKILTDIDALLFDKENNTLLLIQLKWMDDFGTSMKGRNSMSNNFYGSAVKWINALTKWLRTNGIIELMKKLDLCGYEMNISDLKIKFLILGRNFSHFSDKEEDKRAIWCSWYKLFRVIQENPEFAGNLLLLLNHLENQTLQAVALPENYKTELQLGKFQFIISLT